MAIPTQFSVTNTRKSPIANPNHPIDEAKTVTAEDVGFISGASALPAEAAVDICAPSELAAESASDIDSAVIVSSEQQAGIDSPSELATQAPNAIDNAALFSALSNATIGNPSLVAAESIAPVDNAAQLTAELASDVDLPTQVATQAQQLIAPPTFTINPTTSYDFNNTANGWTAVNSPITNGAGFITIVGNQNVQLIRSSLGELDPSENYLLAITLRCTTATVNTTVEVFTANSEHGFSGDFSVQSESVELVQGAGKTIYLNLAQITDFLQDGFTSIRIDPLASVVSHTYEILNISFGVYDVDHIEPKTPRGIDNPNTINAENQPAINTPSAVNPQNYGVNLLTYSEEFDNPAWEKGGVTVSSDVEIAPNGTLTAEKITPSASAGVKRIRKVVGSGNSETYGYSIFAKAAEYKNILVWFDQKSAGVGVNLDDLSIFRQQGVDSYQVIPLADGWVRIFITDVIESDLIPSIYIYDNSATPNITFSGDGGGLFVWGAQLENSPTLGEYTKTESTPITVGREVGTADVVQALPESAIAAPSAATAESAPSITTPSALTANAGTKITPPFPLNHARILYDNVLEDYSTVTANNQSAGYPAINALKPNTYESWRFTTSSSTMQVDFGGGVKTFDMLCIGAHNLGRAGADIQIWYEPEPGGTFVQFDTTKSPPFDQQQHPIVFYSQTAVSALTIEIRITSASGVPSIGYISAGVALQMQRPFFNGHTPITDGDVTEYYSNRTESGEIIGQQIRRQGYETSADWQNLDDDWYRTYFAPFKQAAKLRPFFFAWNLLEYPDDVGFCRIAQDISAPMQNGTRVKRNISMNMLGAG